MISFLLVGVKKEPVSCVEFPTLLMFDMPFGLSSYTMLVQLVHIGIRYFLCRYSMWSCLVQFTTVCSSKHTLRHLNRCQQMWLVHNERNAKTISRQWAEVGPYALEDSKVCNTTKALVTCTLLYRISLFFICQFVVAWLYSSTIS